MSEYTLRAARRVCDPSLIALEVRSLMRGAALDASNMENYSLVSQSTHVTGKLGGPGSRPVANGGVTGPLDSARIGALRIAPLAADGEAP